MTRASITIYIIAAIFISIMILVASNYVHAEIYKEKTCVLRVTQGELAYCYFGNEKTPTTVNGVSDVKRNTFEMIDSFIQFLEHGPIIVIEDEDNK